jgi:hypothetical protein
MESHPRRQVFKIHDKALHARRQSSINITRRTSPSSNHITWRHISGESLQTIFSALNLRRQSSNYIFGVNSHKTVFKLNFLALNLRRHSSINITRRTSPSSNYITWYHISGESLQPIFLALNLRRQSSNYIFGVKSQKTIFKLYYKASQLRRQSSKYITRHHISEAFKLYFWR